MPTPSNTSSAADVDPREILEQLTSDASPDVGAAFADLVASYLARAVSGEDPVSTALDPAEIAAMFAEAMPETGGPLATVLQRVARDVIPESNWLHHPMAMGHQVAPPLPVAIWSESVIAALNQSIAVWEMSPVGSSIEARAIRWMCDLAGYGDTAGGTFTSGGTEATTTALLSARNARFPDAWEKGMVGRGTIVCGADAHYAVTRAAGILGVGTDNLVSIPSRDNRMDVRALAAQLAVLAGRDAGIVAVVATAGSTATGSFDDLSAIAELCENQGIWLHVDGAHGASALFSTRHRGRLRGLDRARSVAWDPHKMMLMPLSAGMLLMRDARDLDSAFAQRAPYLFGEGGAERFRDQGRRSFMCSRRADALKVWIALQRHGRRGIGAMYDHLCETTHGLWRSIADRPDFEAVHEPESNILCFRYVGDRTDTDAALDDINADLRVRYNRSGHGWITTTLLNERRMLRVTIMNPRTTPDHARSMLGRIAELARAPREGAS